MAVRVNHAEVLCAAGRLQDCVAALDGCRPIVAGSLTESEQIWIAAQIRPHLRLGSFSAAVGCVRSALELQLRFSSGADLSSSAALRVAELLAEFELEELALSIVLGALEPAREENWREEVLRLETLAWRLGGADHTDLPPLTGIQDELFIGGYVEDALTTGLVHAEVALRAGDHTASAAYASETLKRAEVLGLRVIATDALRVRGIARLELGGDDALAGVDDLDAAARKSESFGDVLGAAGALEHLAAWARRSGDEEEALRHVARRRTVMAEPRPDRAAVRALFEPDAAPQEPAHRRLLDRFRLPPFN